MAGKSKPGSDGGPVATKNIVSGDSSPLPGRKRKGKTGQKPRASKKGKPRGVKGAGAPEIFVVEGVPVCYHKGKRVPLSDCFDVDINSNSGNLKVSMKKACVMSRINKKKFREEVAAKSKVTEWYGLLDGVKWKE